MHLVVFEDSQWHAFAPFSLSRPVFGLASGMTTLLRKQIRALRPTRLTLWVRPEMEAYCRHRIAPETNVPTQVNVPLDNDPAFLVNGRVGISRPFTLPDDRGVAMTEAGEVAAASTGSPGLSPADVLGESDRWRSLGKLPPMPAPGRMLESPVEIIYWNEQSLIEDFAQSDEPIAPKPAGPYHLVNELDIRMGQEVTLSPGCVLDASKGPIAVADGAMIGHNAVVQGPCWIGPGSAIAPLALIRAGVSIGAFCKVGGEISVSIILGYSNKSHEGFVGHSYLGKWVNLGAGTTTSNMKNTYGPVTLKRGDRELPTGRRFVGALIGDHTKTAILTRLMTGTYVGFCSMLAGAGPSPRFVPSYTFWTERGAERYDMEKAVEVAQRVFTRRERIWTDMDEQIFNYVGEAAPRVNG